MKHLMYVWILLLTFSAQKVHSSCECQQQKSQNQCLDLTLKNEIEQMRNLTICRSPDNSTWYIKPEGMKTFSAYLIWVGPAIGALVIIIILIAFIGPCSPQQRIPKEHIFLRVVNVKKFKKSQMKVELMENCVVVKVYCNKKTLEEPKQKMSIPMPEGIKESDCFATITKSGFLYVIMLKDVVNLAENPLMMPKSLDISTPVNVVHLAGFSQGGRSRSLEVLCDDKPQADIPNRGCFTLDLKRLNINVEMGVKDGESFSGPLSGSTMCLHHSANASNNNQRHEGYQHLGPQYVSIDTPVGTYPRMPQSSTREAGGSAMLPEMSGSMSSINVPLGSGWIQNQRAENVDAGNQGDNSGVNGDEDLSSFPPPPPVPFCPDSPDDYPPPPPPPSDSPQLNPRPRPSMPPPMPPQVPPPMPPQVPPQMPPQMPPQIPPQIPPPGPVLNLPGNNSSVKMLARSLSVPCHPRDLVKDDSRKQSVPSISIPPPPHEHPSSMPPPVPNTPRPPLMHHVPESHPMPPPPMIPLPPVPPSLQWPQPPAGEPPSPQGSLNSRRSSTSTLNSSYLQHRPLPPPPLPPIDNKRHMTYVPPQN